MAQELTFNISDDRRKLLGPVEAKDFNLKFDRDGQEMSYVDPKNWVQGRIGDESLKQVFVNIEEGKDNHPKDVSGMFLRFCGVIFSKDGKPHLVIAQHGSVSIDPQNGRFRFDFPKQAFTVAGAYQQAFFQLIKAGTGECVATLEFDMEVLSNFVFSAIVPEDWVEPFNDTLNQLLDSSKEYQNTMTKEMETYKQQISDLYNAWRTQGDKDLANFKDATKADLDAFKKANASDIATFKQQYADAVKAKQDELQAKVDNYTDKLDTLLKDLNQQGIDTTTMLTELRSQMAALQDKIKSEHLFTEDEADAFKQAIEKKIGDVALLKAPGTGLAEKVQNEFSARAENVTWHGVIGDGKTDNTKALQELSKWVDQQGEKRILYFPPGKYLWNETVQFNTPVVLIGTEDSWLKYTGTGDSLLLGPDGVTNDTYIKYQSFTVKNLCFTGGEQSKYLIHFNKYITQPRVTDCQFHNAGGTDDNAYAIYFDTDNWDGRVSGCQWDATADAGQRQFVSMAEYGNSRIVVENNLVTSLTAKGTAVFLNGVDCQIIANKIEGFTNNIRLGAMAYGSVVAYNYFEKSGSQKRSAVIELGDLDPSVKTFPYGIQIIGNYANLHNVPDKMWSYFLGPSNDNVLIAKTNLESNFINAGAWTSKEAFSGYLVYENNLPNQLNNFSSGNRFGLGIKGIIDNSAKGSPNAELWESYDSNQRLWSPINKDQDMSDNVFVHTDRNYYRNVLDENWKWQFQEEFDRYHNFIVRNPQMDPVIKVYENGQISFGKSSAVTNYDFARALKAVTIGISQQVSDGDAGQLYEGTDGNLYYRNLAGDRKKLTN